MSMRVYTWEPVNSAKMMKFLGVQKRRRRVRRKRRYEGTKMAKWFDAQKIKVEYEERGETNKQRRWNYLIRRRGDMNDKDDDKMTWCTEKTKNDEKRVGKGDDMTWCKEKAKESTKREVKDAEMNKDDENTWYTEKPKNVEKRMYRDDEISWYTEKATSSIRRKNINEWWRNDEHDIS